MRIIRLVDVTTEYRVNRLLWMVWNVPGTNVGTLY